MLVAIALFGLGGCRGDATIATPPAPPSTPAVPLPPGRPIFRDCDGSLGLSTGLGWWSITGCSSRPALGPAPDMEPALAPASAPAPAPDPEAAAEPPPPPRSPADSAARPAFHAEPANGQGQRQVARDGWVGGRSNGDMGVDLPKERDHRGGKDEILLPRGPEQTGAYDWGGTAFLSNDDSMSLASAQRVLWALAHGQYVSSSQVRPHELLNYFSFDTVPPQPGRTFGVLGSAARDGDVLTVAMAVRGAVPQRRPLDLTVVVDRSGSMSAQGKMDFTKRGLHEMVQGLHPGDRVDLVLFDDEICTPIEGLVVGRDSTAVLDRAIDAIHPRASTNLGAGLAEAWRIQTGRSAADVQGRDRRVLLVTDAELNQGTVDPNLISEVGRQLDQQGIHLSGVGVGQDFDDRVLDELTEKGRGAYVFLGSEAVVDRVFGAGFDALVETVADDVHFSIKLPPSLAMKRFYGEESSKHAEDVKPVEFHAGTTQLFLQDLEIKGGGLVADDPITLEASFRDPATGEPVVEDLRTTVGALLGADPHNVRKGRALMAFSDWVLAGASGGDACGAPARTWWTRAAPLRDDAEIAYVGGLVSAQCGAPPFAAAVVPRVELKVKLDSDTPVSAVDLSCVDDRLHRELTASDTVARFDVTPGTCRVELQGVTPMAADLQVPSTGAEVWCRVRGGRLSCG